MIKLRLIPVLDILNGVVVRGVAGRRSEYRPIASKLTSSVDPVEVACALIEAVHPQQLYVADLDAIQGGSPAFDVYRSIQSLGVRLWVDAGVRDAEVAKRLADVGCDVVAGLETIPGPEVLRQVIAAVDLERVIFSLDLRDEVPLNDWRAERRKPPDLEQHRAAYVAPLAFAVNLGFRRVIVLDLARVGSGSGTGTEGICREIAFSYPQVEVIAGGGVAGPEDLRRLEGCGVKAVLLASALHDKKVLSTEY